MTYECFSIGAECDAGDSLRMSGEGVLEPTRLDIPQVDRIVTTRRCECGAIWTERYVLDRKPMSSEDMVEAACFGIPQIDDLVSKSSTSNCAAIWTERHTPDMIGGFGT